MSEPSFHGTHELLLIILLLLLGFHLSFPSRAFGPTPNMPISFRLNCPKLGPFCPSYLASISLQATQISAANKPYLHPSPSSPGGPHNAAEGPYSFYPVLS